MGSEEILSVIGRAKHRMYEEKEIGLSGMMAIMAALEYIIKTLGNGPEAEEPVAKEEQVPAGEGQAAGVKPKNKKEKAKKGKKTDYGKITALYKAGWTQAKIADEMGVTATAVSAALKRYREKLDAGYIWDAETRGFIERDEA